MSVVPSSSASTCRVLVIDDEPAARRGVRLLLRGERDIEVVGEAGDVMTAIELVRDTKPDLIFLDVQMPGGDGFDVLRKLSLEERPLVIFITAYDQHALRAFEVHAVDNLLKPFDDNGFKETLVRMRSALRSRETSNLNAKVDQLIAKLADASPLEETGGLNDRIVVKSSGEIFFLKPEEIDWIEAEGGTT
ncbi:MAG: response regulator [Candidatus Synoicihabitans palmerolidicus]|nr:response regulator [Candidatus Synoicihabitans palmerolidicus]